MAHLNNIEKMASCLRKAAHPLLDASDDFTPLVELIGDKPIVLLGESTHGTHEFYHARMLIARRLIEERGFESIVLEADWPDCLHLNRHLHAHESDSYTMASLDAFKRFPQWMWRNSDFLAMADWLFVHNRKETTANQVSVFGMDLYSLYTSIREVIHYLDRVDPQAGQRARDAYSCFAGYERDPVRYGRAIRIGTKASCEKDATRMLVDLNQRATQGILQNQTNPSDDELFYAQQNARVVKNAEEYYRQLFSPFHNTWNLRDTHMADTIDALRNHLRACGRSDKIVIWAHNSHIGDDRASEMKRQQQINLGQLLRERHPGETFHLGFTTFTGSVQAADEWDEPSQIKEIIPALEESWEAILHRVSIDHGPKGFFLDLQDADVRQALQGERLERAIGVIYNQYSERLSHYFRSSLPARYDAIIHFDRTMEVEPIDRFVSPLEEVAPPTHLQL
jgi:erythromycin esterase-like protein